MEHANRLGDFLRALRLAPDGRQHAFRLAHLSPSAPAANEEIAPELLQIMDAVPNAAAYVTNPAFRILLANPTATALIAPVNLRRNMLSTVFLERTARVYYVNWDEVSRASVSALRHSAGFSPRHPEVDELVAELTAASAAFRALWNDRTVSGLTLNRKIIHHPAVGEMELNYQTFDVRRAPGQQLTVVTAESGSPSAAALAGLISP